MGNETTQPEMHFGIRIKLDVLQGFLNEPNNSRFNVFTIVREVDSPQGGKGVVLKGPTEVVFHTDEELDDDLLADLTTNLIKSKLVRGDALFNVNPADLIEKPHG